MMRIPSSPAAHAPGESYATHARLEVRTVFHLAFAAAITLLAPMPPAAAQNQSATPKTAAPKTVWAPPRTPFGDPDIQGIWSNASIIPLERPKEMEGKQVLSREEMEQIRSESFPALFPRKAAAGRPGGHIQQFLVGCGFQTSTELSYVAHHRSVRRKVPPLTPAAQRIADADSAYGREHPADGPEDRPLMERCLLFPMTGPPMLPSFYDNHQYGPLTVNYQFVQAPGSVTILVEVNHDVRVIPLDGRPHLPPKVRQWMGDPRGHWEGNTLVVDTTNFTGKTNFRGADENLHLTERFTRKSPGLLLYEFTVDDPTAFTRSWKGEIPMIAEDGPLYEHACHEGNYGLAGILSGARAEEKQGK